MVKKKKTLKKLCKSHQDLLARMEELVEPPEGYELYSFDVELDNDVIDVMYSDNKGGTTTTKIKISTEEVADSTGNIMEAWQKRFIDNLTNSK